LHHDQALKGHFIQRKTDGVDSRGQSAQKIGMGARASCLTSPAALSGNSKNQHHEIASEYRCAQGVLLL
jgi:hypothetical protein